ncbi:TetR/AcrR family transcriptional regulator [Labrys okinawensis]|uniref:TetR/AcrR family transcriptional regulator n=1 Tax=Labrys okinawensis TaxID=346911 RepID=UPI0039BD8865
MEPVKSRGGRPWSFDRGKAVETAMRLFWQRGYEGVSVGDLTEAIGIAPPSLYAAFGSKAGLYQVALTHYEEGAGSLDMPPLNAATTLTEAVRLLLEAAVRTATHSDRERGCMISSGMITCPPEHAEIARDLAARREAHRERIAQVLERFGSADEVRRLSRHLVAVMQGISIQARDGVEVAQLQEVVEEVVSGIASRFGDGPRS